MSREIILEINEAPDSEEYWVCTLCEKQTLSPLTDNDRCEDCEIDIDEW